jgi:hypothetical protein
MDGMIASERDKYERYVDYVKTRVP